MTIYVHLCERCRFYDQDNNLCVRPPEMMLALEGCAIDDYKTELYKTFLFENFELLKEANIYGTKE